MSDDELAELRGIADELMAIAMMLAKCRDDPFGIEPYVFAARVRLRKLIVACEK